MIDIFSTLQEANELGLDMSFTSSAKGVHFHATLTELQGRGGIGRTCSTAQDLAEKVQEAFTWAQTVKQAQAGTQTNTLRFLPQKNGETPESAEVAWNVIDPWRRGPQWQGLVNLPGGYQLSILSQEGEMITDNPQEQELYDVALYLGEVAYPNTATQIVPFILREIGYEKVEKHLEGLAWQQVQRLIHLLAMALKREGHNG